MKTILVSGASGIVGYGILRCLKDSGYRLVGTTIYQSSPAECFSDIVEIVPRTTENEYYPALIDIIKKYNVDMIIPGIEADMSSWNRHRDILEASGAVVLLNSQELVDLCLDKWMFYQELTKCDITCSIPSSICADFEQFKTPFILKPRCGFGSQGVIKVDSEEMFAQYQNQIGNRLMMQKYIGSADAEYTVSAFFDIHSKARALIMMKRVLSKDGFTEQAEIVDFGKIEPIILKLADYFHPVGPTNFQFRQEADNWKLLEINPRISSSVSIKKAFGYNECQMAIDYFLDGKEIDQPEIKKGKAIRYVEDFVIYDSDNI